jgi:hypothetical protein
LESKTPRHQRWAFGDNSRLSAYAALNYLVYEWLSDEILFHHSNVRLLIKISPTDGSQGGPTRRVIELNSPSSKSCEICQTRRSVQSQAQNLIFLGGEYLSPSS